MAVLVPTYQRAAFDDRSVVGGGLFRLDPYVGLTHVEANPILRRIAYPPDKQEKATQTEPHS